MKLRIFKRIGAAVTAVAMIASLGTVAFAEDASNVSIDASNLTVTETETAGEYTVAFPYTTDANLGEMGLTMLTYTGTGLVVDTDNEDPDNTTYYDEENATHKVVGINQWGARELPDANGADEGKIISFISKMNAGDTGIIMLGGHNVTAPAIVMFIAQWQADKLTAVGTGLDNKVDITGVAEGADEAETKANIKAALEAALDSGSLGVTLTLEKTNSELTSAITDTDDITVTVEGTEGAYTAKFTAPAIAANAAGNSPVHTGNVALTSEAVALNVEFSAWEAQLNDEISIAAEERDDFDTAVETAVKEKGVQIRLGDGEWADVDAEKITVAKSEANGAKAFNASDYKEQTDLDYVVTIAEGAAPESPAITLSIKVTAIADAWSATKLTFGTGADTVNASEHEDMTANELLEYVKNEILDIDAGGRKFNLTNDVYTLADGYIIEEDDTKVSVEYKGVAPDSLTQGGEYIFTITLSNEAETEDPEIVTVDEGGAVGEFKVTYAEDTRWIAAKATAKNAQNEEVTVTVTPENATLANIKTALANLVVAKYVVTDEAGTNSADVTEGITLSAADEWTLYNEDGTTEATLTDGKYATGNYVAKVTKSVTSATFKGEFEVAIKVTVSTPWECGDVNHDGIIDTADAILLLNYIVRPSDYAYVTEERMNEADARKDGIIDTGDAIAVLTEIVKPDDTNLPIIP